MRLELPMTHGPSEFAAFRSNSAQQEQDNHNTQKQAHSAARVITPTPAVWPRRECAEQQQNQQNHQNSS
jgi:hypothetical protein